jgi:hypothetical protein
MASNGKSRMVSFRLNLQEYEQFREVCAANGGNNVSELLRSAVSYLLENGQGHFANGPRRQTPSSSLEQRVAKLESEVQSLRANSRAASSGN